MTINAFPDHILLDIFDFCRVAAVKETNKWPGLWPKIWHMLVHVCSRWRRVVFSSPVRLNLRLYCTDSTSVSEMLDAWPPFPIEVSCFNLTHHVVNALEHQDRVCEVHLELTSWVYKRVTAAAVMQKSFPALTCLHLRSIFDSRSVLPDTFLGGSAPRLRSLTLMHIPFPTLPQFLASCNDLSKLSLVNIPDLGYITPEAMFTGLSALTKLETLDIIFESPGSLPRPYRETRRLPPLNPAVLPYLTYLCFRGVHEYLDDLLVRIDAPQLKTFTIQFFKQHIDMRQVISRLGMLGPFEHAEVNFNHLMTNMKLYQPAGTNRPQTVLELQVEYESFRFGWQVSIMAQICTQSLSLLSSVTELNIRDDAACFRSLESLGIQSTDSEWLELFRPFTAVRTLRLSGQLQSLIVSWLRRLTVERVMEVLPALENFYFRETADCESQQQPLEVFFGHPATPLSTSESESSDGESSDEGLLDEDSSDEELSDEEPSDEESSDRESSGWESSDQE